MYSTFRERLYDIRINVGSYAQMIWNTNYLKKTSFTIGARYDYNNYYGSPVSPRFAIVNQPGDKTTIKLMFGNAYRAPTNTEIYQAPAGVKLKVEKATTLEANVNYKLSSNFIFQVNGFYNRVRDAIILGTLPDPNDDKNPGEIDITGLETRFDILFNKTITGYANFTYTKAIGRNYLTGFEREVSGIAKVKGNIGLLFRKPELGSLHISGNWVGKRNVPNTDPYGPVAGYRGKARDSDYRGCG